jgi:tetratricopeptide (TPR) repeat protein
MRVVRDRCERDGTLPSLGAEACAVLAAGARALGEPWRDPPKTRGLVQQVISLNDHLAHHAGADASPLAEALLDIRDWALWCLHGLGDSTAQAIEFGEFLIADCARILGESHQYTLRSRGNLAGAYEDAGRFDDAISLHERALASYIQLRGGDHPDTARARNNLAAAYEHAGRLPTFRRGASAKRSRFLSRLSPGLS